MRTSTARPRPAPILLNGWSNDATGLHLSTPTNAFTGDDRTISIRTGLTARFDYILPSTFLSSNVLHSQVFRSDLLNPMPPLLLASDDQTASDHLPVLMVFNNPYGSRIQIRSITLTNQVVTLTWDFAPGRQYSIEESGDLTIWSTLATNLTDNVALLTLATNAPSERQFFRVREQF